MMTRSAPYENSKFLGSGGSMVARLKLQEIDGRLTTAKAFAKDVPIDQERRLGDQKRLDTVVVLTVNYAD